MKTDHRQRSGFSLIELLVVIAIIAVLIGIILPALGHARNAARNIQCLSNIRSIGQTFASYTRDNADWYPHWSGWQVYEGDGTGADEPGPGWTELLRDYIPGTLVYHDPARPIEDTPFCYFISARYSWSRYGRQFTALRDSDVKLSSQFVIGGDCNQPRLYAEPYGSAATEPDCDQDDATQPCVFFEAEDGPNGWGEELVPHDGKSNILFFDGHAATFARYEPSEMTWHGSRMRDWSLDDPHG